MPLELVPQDDPRLHQPCSVVTRITSNLQALAQDMLDFMYANNGVGLAAPQVGYNVRLVVADWSDDRKSPLVLFNPFILGMAETEVEVTEGCLSFPGQECRVKRAPWVKVYGRNLKGRAVVVRPDVLLGSVCLQHEIDHLDGITFDQRGLLVPGIA